jgi:hypothetical protein
MLGRAGSNMTVDASIEETTLAVSQRVSLTRLLPGISCSWRNPGLKRTRIGAILKKFFMKTILKSKRNLIRKTLNFVSIQWNYLQAFSISWDYPFNVRHSLARIRTWSGSNALTFCSLARPCTQWRRPLSNEMSTEHTFFTKLKMKTTLKWKWKSKGRACSSFEFLRSPR